MQRPCCDACGMPVLAPCLLCTCCLDLSLLSCTCRNSHNVQQFKVDLHGLHVEEALQYTCHLPGAGLGLLPCHQAYAQLLLLPLVLFKCLTCRCCVVLDPCHLALSNIFPRVHATGHGPKEVCQPDCKSADVLRAAAPAAGDGGTIIMRLL